MPTITITAAWTASKTTSGKWNGSVAVTDTTNYAGAGILLANVTTVATVTHVPTGAEVEITINPATSTTGSAVLPIVSGSVLEGEYTITAVATITGPTTPGAYTSNTITFDFCPTDLNITVTAMVDCVCGTITFTDETDLSGGWSLNSKSMTLTPPTVSGNTPVWGPLTTTNEASVSSQGYDLYKGTYTLTMAYNVTKDSIVYVYNYNDTKQVDCKSVCELFCALDSFYAKIKAEKNPATKAQMQDMFNLATSLAVLANQSQSCDTAAMDGYITDFYAITTVYKITGEGDCCSCCTDSDIIQPRCGSGAGGTTYAFFSGTPVYLSTPTVTGTNVTYSLTAYAVALIEAIRVYDITSTDGSVSYSTSGGATPGSTRTFNLSVTTPSSPVRMFTYTENFAAGTAAFTNDVKRGSEWAAGSPTAANGLVGAISVLEFSNLCTGLETIAYVDVTIAQNAVKAFEPPTTHINEIVRCSPFYVNLVANKVQIMFFDLGSMDIAFRALPIMYQSVSPSVTSVDKLLASLQLNVIIYLA